MPLTCCFGRGSRTIESSCKKRGGGGVGSRGKRYHGILKKARKSLDKQAIYKVNNKNHLNNRLGFHSINGFLELGRLQFETLAVAQQQGAPASARERIN
jgi:hypothetical protein